MGTLNFITDEVREAGGPERDHRQDLPARAGHVGGRRSPERDRPGRFNPIRTMSYVNVALSDDPEWICSNEDIVTMPLQCATHWDGLAHVSYGGKLYNGFPSRRSLRPGPANAASTWSSPWSAGGFCSTWPGLEEVDVLDGGYAIQPGRPGRRLRARWGQDRAGGRHPRADRPDGQHLNLPSRFPEGGHRPSRQHAQFQRRPALHGVRPRPLHGHGRVVPRPRRGRRGHRHPVPRGPSLRGPRHLPPGPSPAPGRDGDDPGPELASSTPLAADCAEDGVYTFLLDATPLPLTNALGSPVNPVAVK